MRYELGRFVAALLFGIEGFVGPVGAQSTDSLPPLDEEVTLQTSPYLAALAEIEAYLASLDSFEARFRQTNPSGGRVEGIMYLEQPGRVRFDYTDDVPFLVVADGEVLSFVDYEVGQVTRWPVADTPLKLFLADRPNLASLGARIQLNPAGLTDHVALQASDPEKPDQGVITVYFRRVTSGDGIPSLELRSWVVEDAQGLITVVEVFDGQANPDLSASLWTFEDPRGLAKRRRTR